MRRRSPTSTTLGHLKRNSQPAVPRGPTRASAATRAITFHADVDFDTRVRLFRHGSGAARIRQVEVIDAEGRQIDFVEFNEDVILRVAMQYYEDAPFSILGYGFRDKSGI